MSTCDLLPDVLSAPALAKRLGVDRSTLYRWAKKDARLRGCVIRETKRSTYYSSARLIERGYLVRPEAPRVAAIPALSFTASTREAM